jgi:hypothetical protein
MNKDKTSSMKRFQTFQLLTLTALTAAASTTGSSLAQDPIEIDIQSPSWDRWMYSFNASPGFRPAASTFGFWTESVDDLTENRRGQIVFGFDTSDQLAPGQTAGMRVTSVTVTLQQSNEGVVYDSTTDPVESMLDPDNPDRIEDVDAGQPIELFGIRYRNGWTSTTFPEDGPFGDPTAETRRNVYAAAFRDGELSDISNQIREGWTPSPFAVSQVDSMAEGEVIPLDSVHSFSIDVDDENIQLYLLDGLESGELEFALASMIQVSGPEGTFPNFYMKENALVEFGVTSAATLQLTLEEDIAGDPCDLDGDGSVGGADLAKLLAVWGSDDDEADFDGDNVVGGSDLAVLLGCWDS